MTTKLNDLLGIGLFFSGIFILLLSFEQQGFTQIIGIIGSVILIIVEAVYLFNYWKK